MNLEYKAKYIYLFFAGLLAIPMFLTPFLFYNSPNIFNSIHTIYSPLCHQLTSRSFCFFPKKASVEDCYSSSEFKSSKERVVIKEGVKGYKFPVCSRDVGFYLALFIGGLYYTPSNSNKRESKQNSLVKTPPPIFLIIAILPLALDGMTQFIGLRESTNSIRLITGIIAGFVVPFYLIPMFSNILIKK